MSYSTLTMNEATGYSWGNILPITTETDYYNRKIKFTPTLKRYRAVKRGSMAIELQYNAVPDEWLKILTTDATNKYKAQLEITRLLYENFCAEKFHEIDSALQEFPVDMASPALLVSILSSTFPAKPKLQNRSSFFNRVSKSLTERGKLEPRLLEGLW